jgi:hypothetical protein
MELDIEEFFFFYHMTVVFLNMFPFFHLFSLSSRSSAFYTCCYPCYSCFYDCYSCFYDCYSCFYDCYSCFYDCFSCFYDCYSCFYDCYSCFYDYAINCYLMQSPGTRCSHTRRSRNAMYYTDAFTYHRTTHDALIRWPGLSTLLQL